MSEKPPLADEFPLLSSMFLDLPVADELTRAIDEIVRLRAERDAYKWAADSIKAAGDAEIARLRAELHEIVTVVDAEAFVEWLDGGL